MSIIVLHYTAGDAEGSLHHLCNPNTSDPVSSHYVVDRDGTVYRLVEESRRAWHAGPGLWRGCSDVNSASVGIEIVNAGRNKNGTREPYPQIQIDAVIRLCKEIQGRHNITSVIAHSDMGLGRKEDPGEHFPWKALAKEGIGLWTDDYAKPNRPPSVMLAAIGYDISNLPLAVHAFKLHFYPDAITCDGTRTFERMAAVYNLVQSKK